MQPSPASATSSTAESASSSPSSLTEPSLDLPSSFDDTLDLSEIINAAEGGGGSGRNAKETTETRKGAKHDAQHTEVKLLRSKLNEAADTIKSLRTQIQSAKSSLAELDVYIDDGKYQHLLHLSKQSPEQQRHGKSQGGGLAELSLVDHAALIIHQKVAAMRKKLDREKLEAQNSANIAEADMAEAARTKKVVERRLETSQKRNEELESTVKHLQDQVIDLTEKGRMYDAACRKAASAEGELQSMRLSLTNYSDQLKESSSKLGDCQQRIQILERDNSYLERERAVLVDRAEASEKKSEDQASQLREALTNTESLQLQSLKQQESIKSSYDARLAEEMARLRSESKKEISFVKTNITAQLDRAQKELVQSEQAREEQKKALAHMERQLSDAQSDIKIKTYENKSLLDTRQGLVDDLSNTKEQLAKLQKDYGSTREELAKLRLETDNERKQLRDEIAKKDEQLEAYLLLELKVDSSVQAGKHPGSVGLLSDPKRRIEQAVMLAKQVAELKKTMASLQTKLRIEKESTASLRAKLEASEQAVAQLNQPSAYIVRSAKAREEELQQLRRESKTLQTQLASIQNEKRQLSHQLSDVLDRRQQIEEVKILVQDLRKERQSISTEARTNDLNTCTDAGVGCLPVRPTRSMDHQVRGDNGGSGGNTGKHQDWMVHTIHYATSGDRNTVT